jgi:HSP20 family protein
VEKYDKDNLSLGLEGVFQGLGSLIQLAVAIAETAADEVAPDAEVSRTGSAGSPKGLHAIYGVSVRVGAHGVPIVARFGNVRQDASKEPIVDEVREPMIDVLDEGDHYLVIAELPGIDAADAQWHLSSEGRLIIQASSGDWKYYGETELGTPVAEGTAVSCYANGVLQVRLWKLHGR